MERDSLNSFADDYEFDCEEEEFDEILESPSDAPLLRRRFAGKGSEMLTAVTRITTPTM